MGKIAISLPTKRSGTRCGAPIVHQVARPPLPSPSLSPSFTDFHLRQRRLPIHSGVCARAAPPLQTLAALEISPAGRHLSFAFRIGPSANMSKRPAEPIVNGGAGKVARIDGAGAGIVKKPGEHRKERGWQPQTHAYAGTLQNMVYIGAAASPVLRAGPSPAPAAPSYLTRLPTPQAPVFP